MREIGLIPDGALLIVDGHIREVGPSRRVENLAEARRALEINAAGKVVLPGFVDCHTHPLSGPPRLVDYEMAIGGASPAQIVAVGGGIQFSVRAVRSYTTRRLEIEARKVLRQFIRHGTTTLDAKTGYGLDEATELRLLRVLEAVNGRPIDVVPAYHGANAVPPEYEGRADNYIDWIVGHMLPLISRRRLARFVDVTCGPEAFTSEQARRLLGAARDLDLKARMHCDQFGHSGAVKVALEMGVTSVSHVTYITPDEVELLARSNAIAGMLPGASFHLGLDRYAPARALIDAGAAVALGTGFNPGTSPTCSMQMILSLACTYLRMTPAEAITAATINAAHAVGLGLKTGSLERGKVADLLLMNVSDYREVPYSFGMNLLAMTIKGGEPIYPRVEAP